MAQLSFDPREITGNFSVPGEFTACETINTGHINSTYKVTFNEGGAVRNYLLQRVNTYVFKDPDKLMSNITAVTSFLRKKIAEAGGDPERETLTFLPARGGGYYHTAADGGCWRMCNFVSDTFCTDYIDRPETFMNAGWAFGNFQMLLGDFPIATLYETIPDFHDTGKRFAALEEAVARDAKGRAAGVKAEIEYALSGGEFATKLTDLIKSGGLPLRVTHNDTKLNNILFDRKTGKGICVIDLDTIMPGLSLYDFGDAVRYGANTAVEDERDLSKVTLSLPLYEAYARGYLSACGDALTPAEKELLPFSCKIMAYEVGIRFLTDYLNGDVYFKTSYPDHNLVRCRDQLALVRDIDAKMGEMERVTRSISK